jgi:hypothetical protein
MKKAKWPSYSAVVRGARVPPGSRWNLVRQMIRNEDDAPPPCPHDGIDENGVLVAEANVAYDVSSGATIPADPDPGLISRDDLLNSEARVTTELASDGEPPGEPPKVWIHYSVQGRITGEFDEDLDVSIRRSKTRERAERKDAIQLAEKSLRWVQVLLPKRIRDEEIGDALEDLHSIINDPTCPDVRRAVRWKIISTSFWLLWHAVRHVSSSILGKKAG